MPEGIFTTLPSDKKNTTFDQEEVIQVVLVSGSLVVVRVASSFVTKFYLNNYLILISDFKY